MEVSPVELKRITATIAALLSHPPIASFIPKHVSLPRSLLTPLSTPVSNYSNFPPLSTQ